MSEPADGPPPVINVRNLHYSYKKRRALEGVTFQVAPGALHGFVGPNGAGKTTTLKILATLLKAPRVTVRVFGLDVVPHYKEVRRRVGYMPDTVSMYRQMTVFEYLDFFAAAYGMGLRERDRTIGDVLELTDMTARQNELIKSLSKGMMQRVSLARTLVHDPELLLLDEPAAGLDPRARIEIMAIFEELARMGKTIFISSHILAELATLCDSVTIIDRGRTRYSGTMDGLLSTDGDTLTYVLTLAEKHEAAAKALRATDGVTEVIEEDERPVYRVTFRADQLETNDVLQAAIAAEARIVAFQKGTRQLDEAFMALTDPGVPE
jgi:ABC-2 type transport system ATP-binding protein